MTNSLFSPLNDASLHRVPPTATPLPASGTQGKGATHVLEPGQSPEDVAHRHGVTEHALRVENDLGPGQAVYPGTVLRIPAAPAPGPGTAKDAQAAGFTPFDPGSDQTGSPDNVAIWVPDFTSMSPEAIQKYLESPEFKQMAASEREVAERLYNAGMKQAAMDYLAASMKNLLPEVAARLAEECKEFINQLARDPDVNEQMYAVLAGLISSLLARPAGQALLREFAHNLAGAMDADEAQKFVRTIHEGAPGREPLKILVLKALLPRAKEGALESVQPQQLENTITELVKEIYQNYRSAQAAKTEKDKEFLELLARVGSGLSDKQKQELYKKFVSAPENSAVYERAASTAAPLAEAIAVATSEVVALLLNRYESSDIPELVESLSSYGQGVAALQVLLTAKNDPAVLAKLESQGVDVGALERKAAASALAQSTLENGGDVKSGLNALFEALKGSSDGVDGVVGKLEKLLATVPEGRCPSVDELSEILDQSGALRDIVGGILSMAVALTAPSPETFEESMGVLLEFSAATGETAGGIVAILSQFAAENGRLANVLESAAGKLKLLNKALGTILSVKSVLDSIQQQMENGEINARDMFNIASGMLAIAAAFPTPASPFLALASVVVTVVGEIISNTLEEQEMQARVRKYLGEIGFDKTAANVFATSPELVKQLSESGFSPEQIQDLARKHPDVFTANPGSVRLLSYSGFNPEQIQALLLKHPELFEGRPVMESAFIDLMRHMQTAGFSMDEFMQMLDGMSPGDLQQLTQVIDSLFTRDFFATVIDRASLERAFEKVVANYPEEGGRAAGRKLLDWIRNQPS